MVVHRRAVFNSFGDAALHLFPRCGFFDESEAEVTRRMSKVSGSAPGAVDSSAPGINCLSLQHGLAHLAPLIYKHI